MHFLPHGSHGGKSARNQTIGSLGVTLPFLWLCLVGTVLAQPLDEVEMVLAGIYVNGRYSGEVDGYRQGDQEVWLALADLERVTGLKTIEQDKSLLLKTPIGKAELQASELYRFQGKFYLSATQLWFLLRIKVTFSQSRCGSP